MSKKEPKETDLELKLFFDTKRLVKEVEDPNELLEVLQKKKAGIKRIFPATDSWHGYAEELIDAEIERIRTEIDNKRKPKNEMSPIEKIKLVEDIRKRPGIKNYDEALKIAEKEAGQPIYKNYNSFKVQRKEYEQYL
ncbi:MAG: hypothetical protein HUJ22_04695 [Gracilimonas sp.]|uniref:hypothetical protein n=1 Tax=Gracilimonas sp. TaxID=1974203 RepID=UPI0019C783FD|nr:hypothetical protein [Gracilimonas sp.]MBD3615851.1 hypothetical protein [Gracilimonas sp.]